MEGVDHKETDPVKRYQGLEILYRDEIIPLFVRRL
jgi:hypothetical protein